MTPEEIKNYIVDIPDEVMSNFSFSSPWQYNTGSLTADEDGFGTPKYHNKEIENWRHDQLQEECWNKFHRNPQVNTSIRGSIGRLAGLGFETSSSVPIIQEAIKEIEDDHRNRLWDYWPKYVGRTAIEGELFQCLTVHLDGFIEIDFIDPATIVGTGDEESGILFHPNKTRMPLMYNIQDEFGNFKEQIPSYYIARYPELMDIVKKSTFFDYDLTKNSRSSNRKYKKIGGFKRFIISWDKGFLTKRAVSYLRTTLVWLNHYENLKQWEIDWKKSAGAYLWIFKITDPRTFKMWLSLSDEDKKKTGIMSKKTPGSSLVLPPGVEVDVKNPNLTKISEQDTDILDMIASGLNEAQDTLMGSNKATYASSKSNKGPASDRISDEIAYFGRFLRHDFWDNIFFLKSAISNFPETFKVREAVEFKNKKPVFKNVAKKAYELVDIQFPVSENIDLEGTARAVLGVKHGPVAETVGVPNKEVAHKLGISGYGSMRLKKATEDDTYPKLEYNVDAESMQETKEGKEPAQILKKKSQEGKVENSTTK